MELLTKNKSIYDTKLLLMYKGAFSFELITSIIETLGDRISELEPDQLTQKRFYGAATECIQNLYHHMDEIAESANSFDIQDARSGLLMATAKEKFYSIMTGNFVPTPKVQLIQSKLDRINALDKDGMKQLYKEILYNGEFSDKGTAGLGFVEIARKTDQKLIYEFRPINEDYSYFTLQVNIPKTLNPSFDT